MRKFGIHGVLIAVLSAVCADAGTLAIVNADSSAPATAAQAALLATGRFDAVDLIDAYGSSPVLGTLSGYDAVLAYSNRQLWDPTGLGNVLAQYYNLGGKHLTLATYAFSGGPLEIGGAMGSGNYAALTYGSTGDVSGSMVATDGSGVDMIARSANGVIDVNIYPGGANSQATYGLLANTLTSPEPRLTILVLGALAAGFRGWRRSRR